MSMFLSLYEGRILGNFFISLLSFMFRFCCCCYTDFLDLDLSITLSVNYFALNKDNLNKRVKCTSSKLCARS